MNKILVGLILSVFSIIVYMHYRPFVKDDDDDLANVCQLSIFFTIFSALLIHVRVDERDGYDSSLFGLLLVCVNILALAMVVIDFLSRPFKVLFRMCTHKHIHSGTLVGPLDEHKDGVEFVRYFESLAASENVESGYDEFLPSGIGWASWATDAGVKLEWRSNAGDGPINEGRVTFTVDQPLFKVHKYLKNEEFEQRECVDQCMKMGESTDHRRVLYTFDMKRPFRRAKDYLMEEFDCDSRTWPGGKLLVSRSIFDDEIISAKQSKVMGLDRVNRPLQGYMLRDHGFGDRPMTQVVFICTVNVANLLSDVAGQVEIPKSLRTAVDELLHFSFVEKFGNNPEDTRPSMFNAFSGFLTRLRSPSGNVIKHIKSQQATRNEDEDEYTVAANPIAGNAATAGLTKYNAKLQSVFKAASSSAGKGRTAEMPKRQGRTTEIEMEVISGRGVDTANPVGKPYDNDGKTRNVVQSEDFVAKHGDGGS